MSYCHFSRPLVLGLSLLLLGPFGEGMAETSGEGSAEWFYRPIQQPPLPSVERYHEIQNPVDRFVVSKWEAMGLEGAPLLGKRALLRRVTFDLLGLPPTPEDYDRFLSNPRPDAYEAEVERLLASPQYGERWARHWMDVVRYADTDGFAIDGEKPTMWRYRDYVIRAFNQGRPFDQFVREQLAGDEIDQGAEGLVATGFYRLGPWEADNMIKENKRQDYLNEITGTIGTAFLGLTVGCARCHDHKYDPIPTEDFYGLQAFVAPVKRVEKPAAFEGDEVGGGYLAQKRRVDQELQDRKSALEAHRAKLRRQVALPLEKDADKLTDAEFNEGLNDENVVSKEERQRFETLKNKVSNFKDPTRYAAVAVTIGNPDAKESVPVTHVLRGGDVASPQEAVKPHVLSAVKAWSGRCYEQLETMGELVKGRRRALADWIASKNNPLTARVMVNRLWQFHFGVGLVATPNDFGVNGSRPSHPELLDYLASQLLAAEWQLKPLHRLLVQSRVYRQSSRHERSAAYAEIDPDNRALWRANFRRVEAEALRDAMLHVSGELNEIGGGPGYRAQLPSEMEKKYSFFTWVPASASERARRSVYMFQRRNMVLPFMESFDAADASESCGRRTTSVNSTQVFMMLNSEFAYERSGAFAERLRRDMGSDPKAQVNGAFQVAFGRAPDAEELEASVRFLTSSAPGVADGDDALRELCLVMFNSNEFCYLE